MEDSKLFKNLWRFNAFIIAGVGIAGLVISILIASLLLKEFTKERKTREVVNIDPETQLAESFKLGNLRRVSGFSSVIVPLYTDQKYSLNYSGSKSTISTRNILFVDMKSEVNSWLLKDNSNLISSYSLVSKNHDWEDSDKTLTILYQIVKKDTNNDDRLTANDDLTIAFSTPTGNNYTEVLNGVENFLGRELINKETIAVMYTQGNEGFIAYISLTDFKIIKNLKLPSITPK